MAEVEFHYEENITIIQCKEDQKMSDIFNTFISKLNINQNKINYYYEGKIVSKTDKNLTFNHLANLFDKSKKKMKIFAENNLKYDYNTKCDKDIKFPGGEIKMKIQIEEEVVGKTIYFLDNTDGDVFVVKDKKGKWEKRHHDFLKEINESKSCKNLDLTLHHKLFFLLGLYKMALRFFL